MSIEAMTKIDNLKSWTSGVPLEPASLAQPAPRAGVSASSTTSADSETLVPAVGIEPTARRLQGGCFAS